MARQEVVQVKCDRCKRVDLQPKEKVVAQTGPAFKAELMGQTLVYNDLCVYCQKTLGNYWDLIKEWERELKQHLLGEQAPPLSPAPNFTPPQPHSPHAAKK